MLSKICNIIYLVSFLVSTGRVNEDELPVISEFSGKVNWISLLYSNVRVEIKKAQKQPYIVFIVEASKCSSFCFHRIPSLELLSLLCSCSETQLSVSQCLSP